MSTPLHTCAAAPSLSAQAAARPAARGRCLAPLEGGRACISARDSAARNAPTAPPSGAPPLASAARRAELSARSRA